MTNADQQGAMNRMRMTLQLRDGFVRLAHASADVVEQTVLADLKLLVEHARTRVPYYQQLLGHISDVNSYESSEQLLAALPILTRSQVQENLDALQFREPGLNPNLYEGQSTSGSTSKPVTVFKFAPLYALEYDAITLMDWELSHRKTNSRIATFRAVEYDADEAPLGPPLSYVGHTNTSVVRSVFTHSIPELLNDLHQAKPEIFYVNGVVLRQMVQEQLGGGYPDIYIDQILTVSDRIDGQLRELTRQAFGGRINDRYSSEEFGYIALQCTTHDHLHSVHPSVYVEIVDDNNQPCAIGEQGRVLVTSLHNMAQPMIRYQIGDIAVRGAECDTEMKWPVIENIVGRTRDGVTLPDGSFHLVSFFDAPFLEIRNLRDFQIVLFDNAIVFLYAGINNLSQSQEATIASTLSSVFALERKVVCRRMAPDTWQGKWKRREWDRGIGVYAPGMTDEQVLGSIATV